MRHARLLGALAVAILVTAVGTYAVVRHQEAPPTVTCRHLLESTEVESLPATVVSDLRDPVFDVDVARLRQPPAATVDDLRHALQLEYAADQLGLGPEDALACASGTSGELLLLRRIDVPLEHCYGPSCGGIPTERRTCAERWSVSGTAARVRDLGCPDLG